MSGPGADFGDELAAGPGAEAPANLWMVIFTDLISLLLAFFVLLFSMSALDLDAWKSAVKGISKQLNPENQWSDIARHRDFDIDRSVVKTAVDISYLQAVVRDKTAGIPEFADMVSQRLDDRLVLSLPGHLLFPSGSAVLGADGRKVIEKLASALDVVANQIDVVGYTDPNPLRPDARFVSNWDLSLARAVAVARAMVSAGYRRPLQVFGRADGAYYDISNAIPINRRMALSRRVDLIVREDASGSFGR